ncbi:TonB-dependent receptor [Ferrimonas pelagia]|uniref:TonB-dependent receptor n=1 Tax=Ferrimonas pelagia TaxID=1177826 RepID=A0ABP9F9U2_9GAMM
MNNAMPRLTPVAAGIALLLAGNAMAEEQTVAIQDDVEVIRVSGTRASLSEALNEKRFNDAVVDVIAAEDIGVMPDADIGDSLERVSGVEVERGEDGTANQINIRGLPGHFTKTLFNGRTITTAMNANRNFSYNMMPSAFVSQVSVQKSTSADLEEGGIAGTVDLRTHRALDRADATTRVILKGTQPGNSDEWGPDLSFIHTNKFADDTIGLSFGANYLEENNAAQFTSSANMGSAHLNSDDGLVFAPNQIRAELKDNQRERAAAFVNLEWRPSDNLSLFAESFYTQYHTEENRQRLTFETRNKPLNGIHDSVDYCFDVEGQGERCDTYLTNFSIGNTAALVDSTPIQRDDEVWLNTFEAQYRTGDWTIDAGVTFSRSNQVWDSVLLNARTNNNFDMTFDGTDGPWRFYFDDVRGFDGTAADYLIDGNNYTMGRALNGNNALNAAQVSTETERNANAFDLDFTHDTFKEFGAFSLNKVRFGFAYAEEESLRVNYSSDGQLTNAQLQEFTDQYSDNYIPGFNTAIPKSGSWFSNYGSNGMMLPFMTPDVDHFFDNFSMSDLRNYLSDNDRLKEKVNNLYEDTFSSYFRADFGIGYDLTGNIGVRYTRTKQTQEGVITDWQQGLRYNAELDKLELKDENLENIVSRSNTYDYWLPSLNLNYALRDDMRLRFGLGRTMSRPNKDDLELSTTLNGNLETGTHTIATQDPDLQPFTSDNIDLSWEWYYSAESMLAVAYFRKEIDGLVRTVDFYGAGNSLDIDWGGYEPQDVEINLALKTNADTVNLQGFEINYQTPFDFLPGRLSNTGMKSNYTYIDNSNPEIVRASARHNTNWTLYYSERKFDARASWSYRSGYLQDEQERSYFEDGNAAGNNPHAYYYPASYVESQTRLTLSTSYRPINNLRLTLAMSNVTDQGQNTYTDIAGVQVARSFKDNGRRINAGVIFSF